MIDHKLAVFRWRFDKRAKGLYEETMTEIKKRLQRPKINTQLVWLAYRLMEEESMRIAVEEEIAKFMPSIDMIKTGLKTKKKIEEKTSPVLGKRTLSQDLS
jgi:hypothetical protein